MKGKLLLQLDKPTYLFFETIDSTNLYLKNNYYNLNNLTFIKTNYQTNGVGQFGRVWESKSGENLLFSLLLKNQNLNDVTSIKEAVTKALITFLKNNQIYSYFVEPNDIFVNDKKILGILIETKITNTLLDYIIIGIGINVNQSSFNIDTATSMKLETKKHYDTDSLYKELTQLLISIII